MQPHQAFFHEYRMMYRPFINKLNVYLASHQLYSSQWAILRLLISEKSLTLVEISNSLNVEKPTTTRMIQKLIELGYVTTVPGKDKREKKVQLTPFGHDVCKDVQVTIEQFQLDALEGISVEEQIIVSKVLETVRNNLLK
ncbi:MarR family transcriptional regulator [Viridibacillus sp. FSL R5-0477]|uniref:MarR family transcriptional regulator n=1 Tax=Viridibacillus arenosi FSL R5-213 TaxID=1227360 RepID=W4ERX1_9BACL|nr:MULTISPECIES: MarR family transcriptional regulator [Viridibacillus]ETT83009.1 MarR family transcriptional regulator [Viridibacillus arenosi FSL R5-213]OMC82050.1 transcriptional regulator [Viridibacillus sp. FSL H8-0123]OMC86208.1 transcriptional regulator [Viridibacillus sp. FSL H7-0596]OMC90889.1 transcriptional regulator [Viridibacillus arenosi]